MYKLTVVSGPNRGTSYALQQGITSIGRQSGNSIVLSSARVSKRHCSFRVDGAEIIVRDEGSSNGTFVNGVLTKGKKVKPGDRVSVGEFVLEISEPPVRLSMPGAALPLVSQAYDFAPSPAGVGDGGVSNQAPTGLPGLSGSQASNVNAGPPKDLKGKAIWYFENQFMPIFYELNLKHEWRVIGIGMFSAFVIGNLLISVYPLLESSRATVVKETGKRAQFMARQISEFNAPYLAAKAETKADLGIVENADGVRLALLTDLDNRIIAPGTKLNQYLANGNEALFAAKVSKLFRSGRETGVISEVDGSTILAIEPVKVLSPTAGKNVIVAMAIVAIDTSLSTPDIGEMGVVYAETLIFTGILGGLILLVLYRLTLKPFQVLNDDMDKALKGDITQLSHEYKFEEMNSLWDIINSALQRIPKEGVAGGGNAGFTDPAALAEEFVGPLKTLGELAKFGFVVFDADKKIIYLNSIFEEISGIRSDNALGREISESARDQSLGPFTSDLLGRAPVGGEGVHEDYDFSGITYRVYGAAFGNPASIAKCFLMAAVRHEG